MTSNGDVQLQKSTKDLHQVDPAWLKSLIPLKAMLPKHVEELLKHAQLSAAFPGQILFARGDVDYQHIYLLHGDIEMTDQHGNVELVKGRMSLHPLAHIQPRPVDATALTDCTLLRIDSTRLDKLLAWSQLSDYMMVDLSYHKDPEEDSSWLSLVLGSNLFFKVPPTNVKHVLASFQPQVVENGQVILRQGEIGDFCYFIKEGSAEVVHQLTPQTQPTKVAEIGVGRCFGEDALLNETVRNATVVMSSNGVLMKLSKNEFVKLLIEPEVEEVGISGLQDAIQQGAILVDLRTEEEYETEHIKGAVNFPLHLLRNKQRLLEKNRNYIFYCDTGRRSKAAVYLFAEQQYDVVWLNRGMDKFSREQRENFLERDSSAFLRLGKVEQSTG